MFQSTGDTAIMPGAASAGRTLRAEAGCSYRLLGLRAALPGWPGTLGIKPLSRAIVGSGLGLSVAFASELRALPASSCWVRCAFRKPASGAEWLCRRSCTVARRRTAGRDSYWN